MKKILAVYTNMTGLTFFQSSTLIRSLFTKASSRMIKKVENGFLSGFVIGIVIF